MQNFLVAHPNPNNNLRLVNCLKSLQRNEVSELWPQTLSLHKYSRMKWSKLGAMRTWLDGEACRVPVHKVIADSHVRVITPHSLQ